MEIIIVALGLIAYIGFLAVVRGWVLCWLWLWFIVPVFGLPHLSIVQAIGFSLVVNFLTASLSEMKEEDKKPVSERAINGLIFNFIALGIGYIVHLFL
jgi:uncharacterized membrane protein